MPPKVYKANSCLKRAWQNYLCPLHTLLEKGGWNSLDARTSNAQTPVARLLTPDFFWISNAKTLDVKKTLTSDAYDMDKRRTDA